jgi:hypothetical protein
VIDPKTAVSVVSAIIALVSLCVVIYKEFLQGARLSTVIDQITLMRVPMGNRSELTFEALLDDVLSNSPSPQGTRIANAAGAGAAAAARNRERLRVELADFSRRHSVSYVPEPRLLEPYLSDKRFTVSFYCPLILYNSGRKPGHVSSVVLVARSKTDQSKFWTFAALTTIDPLALLRRVDGQKDSELMAGSFIGVSTPPASSSVVHPWFVPIEDANERIISRTPMLPGAYDLRVFGYGTDGKIVVASPSVEFKLVKEHLFQSFAGSECSALLRVEDAIVLAMKQFGNRKAAT